MVDALDQREIDAVGPDDRLQRQPLRPQNEAIGPLSNRHPAPWAGAALGGVSQSLKFSEDRGEDLVVHHVALFPDGGGS